MKKGSILFLIVIVLLPVISFAEETKPAESKKFLEDISFEKGTLLGDVNDKAVALFKKVEEWRAKEKAVIKESLDKVEKERSAEENPKTLEKILTMAKLFGLAALLFVFSIQTAFYVVFVALVFWVIRKIFRFIGKLFKRGPETA